MKKITLILTISLWVDSVFAQKISSYDFSVVKEWTKVNEKLYYGFSLNRGQINK
jgi:hypothetical protein